MGEDEVDRILLKIVEGRSLRDDIAEEGMVFLDERLLGGSHGIAEEHPDLCVAGWVIFEGKGIGEFAAVIREKNIHKGRHGKAGRTDPVFHGRESPCSFRGSFVGKQKAGHEVAGSEVDREDDLSAFAADEGIKFDVSFQMVFLKIAKEIIVSAADLDASGYVFGMGSFARLEFDLAGKIQYGSGVIPFGEVPIDGTPGTGYGRRVRQDVVDMLPFFQPGRDDPIGLIEFGLV